MSAVARALLARARVVAAGSAIAVSTPLPAGVGRAHASPPSDLPSVAALSTPHAGDPRTPGVDLARPVPLAGGADPDTLRQALDRLAADEREAREELSRLGPEIDVARRRMIARGRAYYRHVHAGLLPVSGGFETLVEHATRVERTRRALERDLARVSALEERGRSVAAHLARLAAARAPLELQHEAILQARSALDEAADRRAAFARAFASSTRPPDYLAVYGSGAGPLDPGAAPEGFRALRGRLPFPLAGRAEVRRVAGDARRGPGVEILAHAGASVRAVHAGRVAFAAKQDPYGLAVILDHGDAYHTLTAGLGEVNVAVGAAVAAGERLGAVLPGNPLYFEIRKGGETIDPGPWLGM